jgi:hypothetical protein
MSLGNATLNNVTIADNVASDSGGAGGFGGGVYHQAGQFWFSNTMIVGNNAPQGGLDCYTEGQPVTSDGYNIIGEWLDTECSISLNLGTPDVISNTTVTLLSLNYYASSLPTRALTSGSTPALDGGYVSGNGVPCEITDQRGWLRSLAAPCDIGAFELVPLSTVFLPLVQR